MKRNNNSFIKWLVPLIRMVLEINCRYTKAAGWCSSSRSPNSSLRSSSTTWQEIAGPGASNHTCERSACSIEVIWPDLNTIRYIWAHQRICIHVFAYIHIRRVVLTFKIRIVGSWMLRLTSPRNCVRIASGYTVNLKANESTIINDRWISLCKHGAQKNIFTA